MVQPSSCLGSLSLPDAERCRPVGRITGKLVLAILPSCHLAILPSCRLDQIDRRDRTAWDADPFRRTSASRRHREFINVAGQDEVGITEAGLEAIGADPPAEPQSPAELVATWRERLPAAAVRMLNAVIEAYPDGLDREELAERTGLTASGGTFGAAVGMLRKYALAEPIGRGLRVSEVLVEGGS